MVDRVLNVPLYSHHRLKLNGNYSYVSRTRKMDEEKHLLAIAEGYRIKYSDFLV